MPPPGNQEQKGGSDEQDPAEEIEGARERHARGREHERGTNYEAQQQLSEMHGLRGSEAKQEPAGSRWYDQRCSAQGKQVQRCKDHDCERKEFHQRRCLMSTLTPEFSRPPPC